MPAGIVSLVDEVRVLDPCDQDRSDGYGCAGCDDGCDGCQGCEGCDDG